MIPNREALSDYYTNKEVREEIDKLLHDNSKIQSNLGSDSTEEEKLEAKRKEKILKRKISKLDVDFANAVFIEV